jgi:hypothetical protein
MLEVSDQRRSLTAELSEADASVETEADQIRAGPHRWTPETAREAARLSRESRTSRAERRRDGPPTDADIERGLRERAVSDPRAAEILLRWMQRPKPVDETGGVDLDSMSTPELERLYAGLTRLAALSERELGALVRHVLAEDEDA